MAETHENQNRTSLAASSEHERQLLRRGFRYAAMLLLLVAFIMLLVWLFLPAAANRAVSNSFAEGLQARQVSANVRGGLGWKLFAGRVDGMEVAMEFDGHSKLALSSLRAEWGKSNVALSLIRRGEGGQRDAGPQSAELSWDSARLADYLNRIQGDVLVSQVEISPEAVTVYGTITLAGGKHNIMISGPPKTNDLGYLLFTAEEWQAEGLEMTELLKEDLCAALSFQPDLAPLAWVLWPRQAVLAEDKLTVYCSSSCCN